MQDYSTECVRNDKRQREAPLLNAYIANTTFPIKKCSDQHFFSTTSLAKEMSLPTGLAEMQRLAQTGAKIPFVQLHETFINCPLCHS